MEECRTGCPARTRNSSASDAIQGPADVVARRHKCTALQFGQGVFVSANACHLEQRADVEPEAEMLSSSVLFPEIISTMQLMA